MGTAGFHEANATINTGTALENMDNTTTKDWCTMENISVLNEELARSNYTLMVKLVELAAQINVAINIIQ